MNKSFNTQRHGPCHMLVTFGNQYLLNPSILNSVASSFQQTIVPTLGRAVQTLTAGALGRHHPPYTQADVSEMQLHRTAAPPVLQAGRHRTPAVVPVAALRPHSGLRCRPAAALPCLQAPSWGSSLAGPSFAAAPLQHRCVACACMHAPLAYIHNAS